jgi:hypothetical protein
MMSFYALPVPSVPILPVPGAKRLEAALLTLEAWPREHLESIHLRLAELRAEDPSIDGSLADELSDHLDRDLQFPPLMNRSAHEARILATIDRAGLPKSLLASGHDLLSVLLEIQSISLPAKAYLRNHGLFSIPDRQGNCVEFSDWRQLEPILEKLACGLRALYAIDPASAAIAAMTCIMAAHPFADGNGRAGRILCNLLLRHSHLSAAYLRIYEIGLIARGGWILGLRRAQRQNDWRRLVHILTEGVRLCARVQERSSTLRAPTDHELPDGAPPLHMVSQLPRTPVGTAVPTGPAKGLLCEQTGRNANASAYQNGN